MAYLETTISKFDRLNI